MDDIFTFNKKVLEKIVHSPVVYGRELYGFDYEFGEKGKRNELYWSTSA